MRCFRPWPVLVVAVVCLSPTLAQFRGDGVRAGDHGTFIDVAVSDNGTSVFIHGEAPRDTVRIVGSVEGPRWADVHATELDRVLGAWLPLRGISLLGVPSFYQVSASCPSCNGLSQCEHRLDLRPVNQLLEPQEVAFGKEWIRRSVAVARVPDPHANRALLEELWRWGVSEDRYRIRENGIRINSQSVFYHHLELPDDAPEGAYKVVTTFLGADRVVEVVRSGFDLHRPGTGAWLLRTSEERPWRFGVAMLLLVTACGFLFSRRSPSRTHAGHAATESPPGATGPGSDDGDEAS